MYKPYLYFLSTQHNLLALCNQPTDPRDVYTVHFPGYKWDDTFLIFAQIAFQACKMVTFYMWSVETIAGYRDIQCWISVLCHYGLYSWFLLMCLTWNRSEEEKCSCSHKPVLARQWQRTWVLLRPASWISPFSLFYSWNIWLPPLELMHIFRTNSVGNDRYWCCLSAETTVILN